ncbi:MAG: dTDP-4-dehydrorhamnose reductase [Acidobacteriia bacterium]|nr:dTDP-4-dehydrorhamnose reductase [Terriglobia bacterium]
MRILIIGARGMLGTDLLQEWKTDEVIPATSQDADIRDPQQVRSLLARTRPDWTVLTAAYTDVDGSERNPEQAFAVNAAGAENVARAAQACGSRLFFVSTDYLFDGTATRPYEPEDPIAPLNVYGQSKAAGEKAVRENHINWCIARTSWLFGASGVCFPEKILRAADSRPELTVVADQVGSPTFTRDLAQAIRDLVRSDARGTLHVTNEGSCSWFEFAREILRQAGRASVSVLPTTTAETARPARRPAYSVLSPASLHARGLRLRHWRDALAAYLKELREQGKLT